MNWNPVSGFICIDKFAALSFTTVGIALMASGLGPVIPRHNLANA